ncbi:histone-lysine N-methyltransferase 2D-like [Anthonomus grandis grandis]|uniref:histone-lysine N-methyltransferase 2D-like n=1 Tax=Anthonomus grandis grandis TaxID=2921223 RepID=UPI00216583D6|nr:histone-lysine N-methyltransferase 2D-like [Anthonomus grandis grandis]
MESYHRRLNSKLTRHPGVWDLIETLIDIQNTASIELTQLEQHPNVYRIARKNVVFDARLNQAWDKLSDGRFTVGDFLRQAVYFVDGIDGQLHQWNQEVPAEEEAIVVPLDQLHRLLMPAPIAQPPRNVPILLHQHRALLQEPPSLNPLPRARMPLPPLVSIPILPLVRPLSPPPLVPILQNLPPPPQILELQPPRSPSDDPSSPDFPDSPPPPSPGLPASPPPGFPDSPPSPGLPDSPPPPEPMFNFPPIPEGILELFGQLENDEESPVRAPVNRWEPRIQVVPFNEVTMPPMLNSNVCLLNVVQYVMPDCGHLFCFTCSYIIYNTEAARCAICRAELNRSPIPFFFYLK